MEQRRINPWTWQNQCGFSHGIEVPGANRILYCAGQISTDAAGYTLGNVVRFNFYTTDMEQFHAASDIFVNHRRARGCWGRQAADLGQIKGQGGRLAGLLACRTGSFQAGGVR